MDLLVIAAHPWCFAVELFLISIGSVLRLVLRWCWVFLVDLRGSWGFWTWERVVGWVFVIVPGQSAACTAFSFFAEGFRDEMNAIENNPELDETHFDWLGGVFRNEYVLIGLFDC